MSYYARRNGCKFFLSIIFIKHSFSVLLYMQLYNGSDFHYEQVTTYHSKYVKELNLSPSIEAYIQSRVIKITLESISLDYRRGDEEGGSGTGEIDDVMSKLLVNREGVSKCTA